MRPQPTLRSTRLLTAASITLLFFGTLMPGSWKHSAERTIASPLDLAAMAHVALFAAICYLLPLARWWRVKAWQLFAVALGLALVTEGLQFFAIDRHPNLAGVIQDMTGATIGWASGRVLHRRLRSS
jgi:VanZ like family